MDNRKLHHVWQNRQRRGPERLIGTLVQELARLPGRTEVRRLALLAPIWDGLLPGALAERVWFTGVDRGCIRVVVRDAASRFEFERSVKGRLLRAVQDAFPGWGVSRVQVEFGDDPFMGRRTPRSS